MHTRPAYSPPRRVRSGSQKSGPRRAFLPADLLRRWAAHEAPFATDRYRGPVPGSAGAALRLPGRLPVLLCAPHAVQHPRDDRAKRADLRTGGLALLLAEATGGAALAALGPVPDRDWVDRDDPFAVALRSAVASGCVVLDLHGMRDSHGLDLCVGTRHRTDPAVVRVRDAVLRAARGFRTSVDAPFAALGSRTVLAEVTALGGTGVQVELAARLRDPDGAPEAASDT